MNYQSSIVLILIVFASPVVQAMEIPKPAACETFWYFLQKNKLTINPAMALLGMKEEEQEAIERVRQTNNCLVDERKEIVIPEALKSGIDINQSPVPCDTNVSDYYFTQQQVTCPSSAEDSEDCIAFLKKTMPNLFTGKTVVYAKKTLCGDSMHGFAKWIGIGLLTNTSASYLLQDFTPDGTIKVYKWRPEARQRSPDTIVIPWTSRTPPTEAIKAFANAQSEFYQQAHKLEQARQKRIQVLKKQLDTQVTDLGKVRECIIALETLKANTK